MSYEYYQNLAAQSLAGKKISEAEAYQILTSADVELLPLLNAAFEVRQKYTGKNVTIHIINNAQNGFCPEDCHYCAQAKSSKSNIEEYPLKSDDEILAEAKNAYEKGAHRYCMVFAGRGPSIGRTKKLADLIEKIKSQYPIEICVSAGLLNNEKAQILKNAGLDRLNHNLNTSREHYPKICTTHTYDDRLETLQAARNAGIQLCSGAIIGMGERHKDIIDVAMKLREVKAESIPVNFLMPIEGNVLDKAPDLTPEYCLRVLCLFRFLNPTAEIRVAAGREMHLRSMEVLAFYPASSLFLEGYLNTRGSHRKRTLEMIRDAGFQIVSDYSLQELIANEEKAPEQVAYDRFSRSIMKDLKDLRPAKNFNS